MQFCITALIVPMCACRSGGNVRNGTQETPPVGTSQSTAPASRPWHPAGRVTIVFDIDETLSITDYLTLITGLGRDDSVLYDGAREVLDELRHDFDVLYVTARPQSLFVETREWLNRLRLPPGPVVTSAQTLDVFYPLGFKSRAIAAFRGNNPNVLIGIGDKVTDSEAYAANRMLPLIVNARDDLAYHPRSLLFENWAELGQFFRDRRDLLADPQRLKQEYGVGGESPHPSSFKTRPPLSLWLPLEVSLLSVPVAVEWLVRRDLAREQLEAHAAIAAGAMPLTEIIDRLAALLPGERLLKVQLVMSHGQPAALATLQAGRKIRRVLMDAIDGQIRPVRTPFTHESDAVQAADAARISFHDAIRLSRHELEGELYEAELEIDDGIAIYELSTMVLGRFYEIEINAITGEIVEVEDETAILTE